MVSDNIDLMVLFFADFASVNKPKHATRAFQNAGH